jgi:hypothetical protein
MSSRTLTLSRRLPKILSLYTAFCEAGFMMNADQCSSGCVVLRPQSEFSDVQAGRWFTLANLPYAAVELQELVISLVSASRQPQCQAFLRRMFGAQCGFVALTNVSAQYPRTTPPLVLTKNFGIGSRLQALRYYFTALDWVLIPQSTRAR